MALSAGQQASYFYFIREYCFSGMIRTNSCGEFNVSYGGLSYNRKNLSKKIDGLSSIELVEKLNNTEIFCTDFEDFVTNINLTSNDFVFLDPPYDTDFSTYSRNSFDHQDHIRLCECMKKTQAKIMLIIKDTNFIHDLYLKNFNIYIYEKKYSANIKNRNSREVRHLLITNY